MNVPGSFFDGDRGSSIGSDFTFFAHRDITVWPADDQVSVTLTDYTDASKSRTFTLESTKQFWTSAQLSLNPHAQADGWSQSSTNNLPGSYTNHYVRVKADKRIYVVNGPNRAEGAGFTLDMAVTAPAGTAVFKAWLFLSRRGADLLSRTKQTVTLQSLTGSQKNMITIDENDWSGNGPYYWTSEGKYSWSGELVILKAGSPVVAFYGDYQGSWFGSCCSASFVPSLPPANVPLEPVAVVQPRSINISVEEEFGDEFFNSKFSFDQDSLGEAIPDIQRVAWRCVETGKDLGNLQYPLGLRPSELGIGEYTIQLTVFDNDGQNGTSFGKLWVEDACMDSTDPSDRTDLSGAIGLLGLLG